MSNKQNKNKTFKLTDHDKEKIKKHTKNHDGKSISEKYFEKYEKKRWI